MSEFNLKDLEKINRSEEILDFLVEKGIIKEKKFKTQLAYEKELAHLQFELLKLQSYIIAQKKRVLIIFEGRDAAGKGGTISRMIAKLNPKKYRVVALPKPTEEEQQQWYFQRYIKQLPRQGEIVFFDRSWYNRAMVEPVFGFCTNEQYKQFMDQVVDLERLLVEEGIILFKFFLSIEKKTQAERLDDRKKDPLKQWKIGDLDQQAQEKWEDYSEYIERMFKKTATKLSPWIEFQADDKTTTRLKTMQYLLSHIDGYVSKNKGELDKNLVEVHKG